MKRIKVFSIFPATVFIVLICAVLSLFSPAWADDCTSTLSSDFKIHIPAVQFDTGLYSLDLQYVPSTDGTIWFTIVGAGVVDTLNCDNPSYLFIASETLALYIPSMAYGDYKYWMTLEYVSATAALSVTATASSPQEGFAVTDCNLENVIYPPGLDRAPKSMVFSTKVMNLGFPGTWTLNIPMKSDMITLVEDPLSDLTSPGFAFGAASGFLYVGDDASCTYNSFGYGDTGTCHLEGPGIGLFFIDKLTITDVDSASPQITMIYHLSIPPNQLMLHGQFCMNGECHDMPPEDVSGAGPNMYQGKHKWATAQGYPESVLATEWSLLPGPGIPSSYVSGWPYARKAYEDSPPGFTREIGTTMVIYE